MQSLSLSPVVPTLIRGTLFSRTTMSAFGSFTRFCSSDGQSGQNPMSCTAYGYLGSPRVVVSRCKIYSRSAVTAAARIQRSTKLCFGLFARASGATLEARFAS
jgi:hypothetical protein